MKYTTEVIIELPRDRVVKLFDNSENLFKWQPGLKSLDHLEGAPGQEGAVSRMTFEGRRGDLEMTETIARRAFPREFHGVYRTRGVTNEMYNYFEEPAPGKTRWKTVSVFRFRGLMALMAPFLRSAFTGNTRLTMERFKEFAENHKP